jgi:hypothetical protein
LRLYWSWAFVRAPITTEVTPAADTVDGICDWWVAPDLPDAVRAEVQAAVDKLVARGTLAKSALPESTVFFAAS